MSPSRRKGIVGTLAVAYAAVLAFGGAWFGPKAAVVTMVGAFVVGFAWLWLLVAPWAVEGLWSRSAGGPGSPPGTEGAAGHRRP